MTRAIREVMEEDVAACDVRGMLRLLSAMRREMPSLCLLIVESKKAAAAVVTWVIKAK